MCAILGPIATLVAAGAAVYVTWHLGKGQLDIARRQADTSFDQLRYNHFEKRYAIYKDVQELIRLLLNKSHTADFRYFDVAKHYVIMDEAIFFFSESICRWINELKGDCESFLESHSSRDQNPRDYAEKQKKLLDHLNGMPQRFQQELGFRQLTTASPSIN